MNFASASGMSPAATGLFDPSVRIYEAQGAASSLSRPVFLAPTEDVLVLSLELPLASARLRAQALPFAVEELIAEPLSSVHVIMGMETAPRTHVAAVVGHARMASWIAAMATNAASNCRIIPDVFAIPVPIQHGWSVLRVDDRVLVRSADGTGFAIASDLLADVWQTAGKPSVISFGETLPDPMAANQHQLSADDIDAAIRSAPLDLRQGAYAARATKEGLWLRRAGLLVGAGALLHMLIIAADVAILRGMAADRETQATELLQTIAPGARNNGDIVATLNRVMPNTAGPRGAQFLPLMAQTSEALQSFKSQIDIQSLAFNAADGSLSLSIEGPNLGVLQAVEQALNKADLSPVSGPATTNEGAAQFRVTVRGRAAT